MRLRVPTLQHLSRNWHENPDFIARRLVRLVDSPPHFNYSPLLGAVRDLLVLNVPYDQVASGIRRLPHEQVRNNLLSVLPLIRDHFTGVHPDFCQGVDRRYYPVGRGLMVPFEPPMIYGLGGQLHFPWFSFWRRNPIALERLSLFVTLVDEVLLQDPDLESARFEILDFIVPIGGITRELAVIDAREIPRVHESRKIEMLETFAEGYFRALEILSKRKSSPDAPNDARDSKEPFFPGFE